MTEEEALAERKKANANIERKDNSSLPAGSPMYFYCIGCGAEMVLPEDYMPPRPKFCESCRKLVIFQ